MRPANLVVGGVALFLLAAPAFSQVLRTKPMDKTWDVTLGGGVFYGPDFPGSRTRRALPYPSGEIFYKDRVGFDFSSLSWYAVNTESSVLAVFLSYDFGRQDSERAASFSPGAARLRGLGTLEGTVELGLLASTTVWGIPVYLGLRKAPDGQGHGGAVGHVGVDLPVQITPKLTTALSFGIDWVDENYAQAYYGVTSAQAARTRFKPYDARGGFSNVSANLTVLYHYDQHWRFAAILGMGRLLGDAADSPITEVRNQPVAGLFVTYRF
jgi:outer membrane scaffolding protein for murein synthesis (MipA/OmpV family)